MRASRIVVRGGQSGGSFNGETSPVGYDENAISCKGRSCLTVSTTREVYTNDAVGRSRNDPFLSGIAPASFGTYTYRTRLPSTYGSMSALRVSPSD